MSICAGLLLQVVPSFAVFDARQTEGVNCAAVKMQLFYYYLSPNRDPKIKKFELDCRKNNKTTLNMPKWIDEQLPLMVAKQMWRDPVEGNLNEAALLQTPVSVLYEFFEVTKKTFPPSEKGAGIPPGMLVKEYADMRVRMQMSLDRIYKARLGDSLGGRGRPLIAIFDLILKEMESISDAFSSNDVDRYTHAVAMIASLSEDAYGQLLRPPRGPKLPSGTASFRKGLVWILKLAGLVLVFVGVRMFAVFDHEKILGRFSRDYAVKSEQWNRDFSRQFINVEIKYIVIAPIALAGLIGLVTMNIFVFIILLIFGAYIGLNAPVWVLGYLKARRGKQIDAQLMDALILLSNGLRSGLDIVAGFDMVAKDIGAPMSDEVSMVLKNYQLGTSFEKALEGMGERVGSRLLDYMIKAIVLQRQVGGNLTKVFERIVENIREESKLEEKTKALTAQQKIQSIVVGIMPWIMFAVMFFFQPETMGKFYFSALGVIVLCFCAVWIGIGMMLVRKMGDIQV